jgi:hypothetical protein
MEHDDVNADLRAALGDLAARVDDTDADALSVVRDRGRRRRRRRAGAITSATSALLVVIVLIGVAIAGHDHSPDITATGPAPTPTPTSTSTSTSTSTTTSHAAGDVCTFADLESFTTRPMPTPTIVTKTRMYPDNQARLDPPSPGAHPKVPASVAWAAVHGTSPVARYDISIGSYSAAVPSSAGVPEFWHRLMWVVTGTHVPFVPHSGVVATTAPQPPCFFGTQVTLVDANTGQELEVSTTGDATSVTP